MKSLNYIFMALSDPTRREIVRLLREQDLTPSEMLEHIDATQPTLSHHLDILKRADLIDGTREGQWIRYSLNMGVFEMAMEYLAKYTGRRK
jgi:ArsR family transcriptional regulator, arsenate/arsenite/antimonite-responsive transcriptional repressor